MTKQLGPNQVFFKLERQVILCLFESFGCQNIREATAGRLNIGLDATSIEFSSVPSTTYIN